jgi:hypothetical protein
MAITTVVLILAGVAESRAYFSGRWHPSTVRPYPWRSVAVACTSVLAEGLVFVLFIVRLKWSLLLRAALSGAIAILLATFLLFSELGVDHPPKWTTFHFLWLARTAFLMAALSLSSECLQPSSGDSATAPANPIGIGAPQDLRGPLPHHPACGSAPGGSGS